MQHLLECMSLSDFIVFSLKMKQKQEICEMLPLLLIRNDVKGNVKQFYFSVKTYANANFSHKINLKLNFTLHTSKINIIGSTC